MNFSGRVQRRLGLALALGVICGPALWGADDTGTISGTVMSSDGRSIDAALLLHDLATPRIAGSTPFDHEFSSKKDGSFSLHKIPPGTYEICVDAPHRSVLDPCKWRPTQSRITVTAGQTVSNIGLVVDPGYVLRIRIKDPGKLLPVGNGGSPGAALQLLIEGPKHYEALRLDSVDAGGRNQYVVIPYNTPLILAALGTGVALSDGNGNRYKNDAAQVPIFVPAGSSIPAVTVSVSAKP